VGLGADHHKLTRMGAKSFLSTERVRNFIASESLSRNDRAESLRLNLPRRADRRQICVLRHVTAGGRQP
jgi:hypothetical protein